MFFEVFPPAEAVEGQSPNQGEPMLFALATQGTAIVIITCSQAPRRDMQCFHILQCWSISIALLADCSMVMMSQ